MTTKEESVRKVLKLLELAKRSSEPEEAKAARAAADRLIKKHSLRPEDLSAPQISEAFDELCSALEKFVSSNSETPASVLEAIKLLKQKISQEEKRSVLKMLRGALQIGSFFSSTAKEISTLVEGISSKHGL